MSEFLSESFHFLVVKFSVFLNRFVFVMIVDEIGKYEMGIKHYLFRVPPSFGDSRWLCFMIVAFPGCIHMHFW